MGFFTETSAYVQFEPLDVFKSTLKDKKKKKKSNVPITSLFLQEIIFPSTDSTPHARFDTEHRTK